MLKMRLYAIFFPKDQKSTVTLVVEGTFGKETPIKI